MRSRRSASIFPAIFVCSSSCVRNRLISWRPLASAESTSLGRLPAGFNGAGAGKYLGIGAGAGGMTAAISGSGSEGLSVGCS